MYFKQNLNNVWLTQYFIYECKIIYIIILKGKLNSYIGDFMSSFKTIEVKQSIFT